MNARNPWQIPWPYLLLAVPAYLALHAFLVLLLWWGTGKLDRAERAERLNRATQSCVRSMEASNLQLPRADWPFLATHDQLVVDCRDGAIEAAVTGSKPYPY